MQYRQKDNGMYILSRSDIEEIAAEKLNEYSPLNLEYPRPLKTMDFLNNYLGLIVKYKYIYHFQSGILGLTVMGDEALIPSYDEMFRQVVLEESFGTVLISPHLLGVKDKPRYRYTQMHEAAHFILHQQYFAQYGQTKEKRSDYSGKVVACRKIEINNTNPKTDTDWLEYQADALAAALLMPKNIFVNYVTDIIKKYGIHNKYLSYNPRADLRKAHNIIYEVAKKFAVSYQAAKIRMMHTGVLREVDYLY